MFQHGGSVSGVGGGRGKNRRENKTSREHCLYYDFVLSMNHYLASSTSFVQETLIVQYSS